MKKEIREIKNGVCQITTLDERWYSKESKSRKTKLPEIKFYPSSTWIAGHYPKGIAFYKWLANKGWDEAEAVKQAAGDKGSKVHYACESLISGKEIKMDSRFINPTSGLDEELSVEEYECLMSFNDWLIEADPQILAVEITAFNDVEEYAGTADLICKINDQLYVIDLKTSKEIWEEHKLQISSYSYLDFPLKDLGISEKEWKERKLAILQLGYKRNKKGFKFTEVEDKFSMFLIAKQLWANENPDAKPKQRDYPVSLKWSTKKKYVK